MTGPVKPGLASNPRPIDAEERINNALGSLTTQIFIETPLSEAIQTISKLHQIPIVIDRRALEEFGLDSEARVNIDLKEVTLRSFLRLMLHDLELTYMVKDEVMQITTVEAAEDNRIMKMYALPTNLAAKSEQVIDVMTRSITPETWKAKSTAMALDHVLVVTTTSDVHDEVRNFLAMLSEKYGG